MVDVRHTIAIAGLGAVTGYGWGLGELWKGLLSGKSAAHPIVFDDFVGLAATVPDGGNEEDSATLFGRALYASGREAVADARLRGWKPGARVGFLLCTSLGEVQGWRDFYFQHGGRLRRRHYLQLLPSTAPSMFMAEFGFTGPSMNVGAACASGALGVILARQWIVSGFATDVVVSGTDLSVTPENAWHFAALKVLAQEGTPRAGVPPVPGGQSGLHRRRGLGHGRGHRAARAWTPTPTSWAAASPTMRSTPSPSSPTVSRWRRPGRRRWTKPSSAPTRSRTSMPTAAARC